MERFDAIVIGAGVMGSAAAYHLARDGRRVLLLEQFEIAHRNGSSHGESRIFRFAYTNPAYTRLAIQSLPLWRALEADAGEQLLLMAGGLDFGDDPNGRAQVEAVRHSLERAGCEHEVLDCADMARRFPQWRLPENVMAVYSPDTGTLPATRCVEVQVARAVAHGAAVREREPVREILPDASGAGVVTDQGRYRADRLLIAAGPWSDRILRKVGVVVPLRVSQEQTVYFRPRTSAQQFAVGRFPIWIHHQELPVYGFPDLHGLGVKVAVHRSGPFIAISDYTKTPRPEQIGELRSYLERYLPDAAGEAHGLTPCLYTNTPDEDFVVDSLPGLPHIAFAAGFSGHGFKFGIAIGRALADLVQHGATELEIGHLSLARFRSAGP